MELLQGTVAEFWPTVFSLSGSLKKREDLLHFHNLFITLMFITLNMLYYVSSILFKGQNKN